MVKFKLSKQTLTALWGNFLEWCVDFAMNRFLTCTNHNCNLILSTLANLDQFKIKSIVHQNTATPLVLQIKNPGHSRYFHSLIFNRILHLIYPTLLALGCKLGCEGVVKLFGHFFMLSLHFFVWALTAWNFYRLFFWFTTDKQVCSWFFIFETHWFG